MNFFQIAKAKAESRIECLKNGDGNGNNVLLINKNIIWKIHVNNIIYAY